MKTVHDVSELSGVSVRTLHHYDAIGLLKPTCVTSAGYRLYDEAALKRLQTILLYRELGFPLADIRTILDSPDFDLQTALGQHIELLKLQRDRIDRMIGQAVNMMKGENTDFSVFDRSNMDKYAEEVKTRWGNTAAYRESERKMKDKSAEQKKSIADGLTEQFVQFGKIRQLAPDSDEAQNAVKALRNYITEHFYTCTDEVLAGLGEMYTADERFRQNIDGAGGDGTARFVGEAIRFYLK